MSNVGFATLSVIPSTRGFATRLSAGIAAPLGKAGKDGGDKAGSGFLSSMKGKIGAGIAVVGATAAAGLAKGFFDSMGREDMEARLQSQLGISDNRAKKLGETASRLYRNAWGDSLDDVGAAVVAVESTLGKELGKHEIEPATEKALALADAFEIDTARAVSSVGVLLKSGLVSDADEAFDLLTRGMQEMPAGVRDELLEASDEYSKFFDDLGFSGEHAFSLLTTAAEEGQFGIDKTGDAIKEFGIRATDLSTASGDAYDRMGLSQRKMTNQLLEGGDTAQGAFQKIIDGLLGIEDPGKRAEAAIALFGTPIEDLGVKEIPQFLQSLQDTGKGFGDVEGAAQRVADKMGGTTSNKIEAFRRKALGALADFVADKVIPVIERFADWLGEKLPPIIEDLRGWFDRNWPAIRQAVVGAVDKIVPALEKVSEWLGRAFQWLIDNKPVLIGVLTAIGVVLTGFFLSWAASAAAAGLATLLAAAPIILIGAAIAALVAGVIYAYQNWETFRNVVDAVGRFLKDDLLPALKAVGRFIVDTLVPALVDGFQSARRVVVRAVEVIRGVIEGFVSGAQAVWRRFGDTILRLARIVWDAIRTKVEGVIKTIRGVIQTFTSLIKGDWEGVWNGIKEFFSGIWDQIRAVPEAALKALVAVGEELLEGLWDGIQAVWPTIKEWFEDLPGRIVNLLANAPEWLLARGKQIIRGLFNGIKALWKITAEWFDGLPQLIGKLLAGAAKWLVARGKQIIRGLFNGIKELWKLAADWFRGLPGRVRGLIAGAVGWLVERGKQILRGLWNGVKAVWRNVADWFRGLPGRILRAVGALAGVLVERGKALLRGLFNGIKAVWSNVATWFRNLPGRVLNFFEGAAEWLISKGKAIIRGMWSGMIDAFINVADWLKGMPGRILRFVADAASWLYETGKDIIRGLWKGLKDEFDSSGKSVLGTIKSGTLGHVRALFGINSPSTVMANQVGKPIAQGIASGIKEGQSGIQNRLSLLAGAVPFWFGAARFLLWAHGVALVNGLVRGINDNVGYLQDTMAWVATIPPYYMDSGSLYNVGWMLIDGLVRGIYGNIGYLQSVLAWVSGMIPNWKGPMEKDRKLLTPTGTAIMGGLVAGIQGAIPAVRSALLGATDEISSAGASMALDGAIDHRYAGAEDRLVVEFDVTGSTDEVMHAIAKRVRTRHGGNVQHALAGGGRG